MVSDLSGRRLKKCIQSIQDIHVGHRADGGILIKFKVVPGEFAPAEFDGMTSSLLVTRGDEHVTIPGRLAVLPTPPHSRGMWFFYEFHSDEPASCGEHISFSGRLDWSNVLAVDFTTALGRFRARNTFWRARN